ncbi:MAG: hypothetical protein HQL29_00770 [Candidatus Omnitrophica bacterium]|nr:hypothetical protein [Candidatus Omnitrophota bacterium]
MLKSFRCSLLLILITMMFFPATLVFAKTYTIGVAWEGKSSMQDRIAQGMNEVLENSASTIAVEWHKELDTLDQLSNIVDTFQSEKNGMVILRSSGAEYLAKNPPVIPSFIGGCNNPVQLGLVAELQKPTGNITGVTYFISYDIYFGIFTKILPHLNSVLLLYEEGHSASVIDRNGTKNICGELGIKYQEIGIKQKEDLTNLSKTATEGLSAVILGNQSLIFDNADIILSSFANTPVLAYSSTPVDKGVLCGVAADDVKLGKMLGESIIDVIVNGKSIADVPIKTDTEPKIYINLNATEKFNLRLPVNILKTAVLVEE